MQKKGFTIESARKLLDTRQISARELCLEYLARIKEKNPVLNAFITISESSALKSAELSDQYLREGRKRSLLEGIPIALKDNICQKGEKATAASKMLVNYIAPYDATVVKLLKEAGAVIVGKTNLDEFAMGSSTENSYFGPTRNPYNLDYVAGGSSGGSAVAVAADLSIAALGSDTGGSIRQPASFCGVVGLKPTYGAVSRFGLIAMASSFDQIGPLTKNVSDSAILLSIIAKKDPRDTTSVGLEKFSLSSILNPQRASKKIKIGLPKEYFSKGLEAGVREIILKGVSKLKKAGIEAEEITLPSSKYTLAVYYIIMPAEVSSNLARFDGIRYGYSITKENQALPSDLEEIYNLNRAYGFGPEVKRRIMLGSYVLSAGYLEAYYKQAQKVRRLVNEDFLKAFLSVDFIVTPVSPTPAFKLGEKTADPLTMYLSDIHTVPVNLAGLPALSLPVGLVKGLPVGMQIITSHFEEEKLLAFARLVEEVLEEENLTDEDEKQQSSF